MCLLALLDPTRAGRNLDWELDFRRMDMSAAQLHTSLGVGTDVLASSAAAATVEAAVEHMPLSRKQSLLAVCPQIPPG